MSDSSSLTIAPLWDHRDLGDLLALDALGNGHYRSRLHDGNLGGRGRAFGGQLIGQALMAAAATAPGRIPTSLQLCFMRGTTLDRPVIYEVGALQDGKRYASRHVYGRQGDDGVIDAHLSFQVPTAGQWNHQLPPASSVPPPESLLSMIDLDALHRERLAAVDYTLFERPCLELRLIDPDQFLFRCGDAPRQRWWMRLRCALPDDPLLHMAALAYVSDWWINTASLAPYLPIVGARDRVYLASLNHALWLHRPVRMDDWLLFDTESPYAGSERALTTARVYDRAGRLVASIAQECMAGERITPADKPPPRTTP